jgi:hypothetical protein
VCSNHPQCKDVRTGTLTRHRRRSSEWKSTGDWLRVGWTTWWLWRGACTRSHPELDRENPQRPWYCVSRRGRVGRCQVFQPTCIPFVCLGAGWSSPVARQAHNLKVTGSNPVPATTETDTPEPSRPGVFCFLGHPVARVVPGHVAESERSAAVSGFQAS